MAATNAALGAVFDEIARRANLPGLEKGDIVRPMQRGDAGPDGSTHGWCATHSPSAR
jgi:hypothetical protein